MAYNPDEQEAIIELRSFMLNEVTEPAMKLLQRTFDRSCPFKYNIEYAIHHDVFMIITHQNNSSMDPFSESWLWDFERACTGDILAFPINCFEDDPTLDDVVEADDGFGHANLIIVNRILHTVEHFDPHGNKMNDLTHKQQQQFEAAVQRLFLKGPWKNFEYIPPRKVCPTNGVQNLLIDHSAKENIKSTCRIWCYHFLMERLKQPGVSAAQINKQNLAMLKQGPLKQLGTRVEDFIMDFILSLYQAMNVRFEHHGDSVCLRWPHVKSKADYCVKKSTSRRRGSARK